VSVVRVSIAEKVSVVIAHLWHANWRISNVGKLVQRHWS